MQLIRCTAKLQKEMGLKKSELSQLESREGLLGQWHANLFYINRKKCVIFVNDKTLTNFIVPDVPRSEIRNLGLLFYGHLGAVLYAEGYSEKEVELVRGEYKELDYAASDSRNILGNIKDLIFHYEFNIHTLGGVNSAGIPDLIKQLNRMPMNASRECIWPYQLLRSTVDSAI